MILSNICSSVIGLLYRDNEFRILVQGVGAGINNQVIIGSSPGITPEPLQNSCVVLGLGPTIILFIPPQALHQN